MSANSTVEDFEARFKDLISFVNEALAKVQADDMPDLTDLDERVSALCQDIETAEAEIAQQVQPLMADMIGRLDELAQALSSYQQKMQALEDGKTDGEKGS